MQQAAAKTVIEMPYEEAHTFFHDLTGVPMALSACIRSPIKRRKGSRCWIWRRHVRRSKSASLKWPQTNGAVQWSCSALMGRLCPRAPKAPEGAVRAKGAIGPDGLSGRGRGAMPKAFAFISSMRGALSICSVGIRCKTRRDLGDALQKVKDAGLIPEDRVRLCVVCDGASWIWKHVQSLFPQARQVLDYYHCKEYLHKVAKAQYGNSELAQEWTEATLTRLYLGKIGQVLGGLRRMQPTSDEALKAIDNCWVYLSEHRGRTHYRKLRRGGYPLGSGGMESSNKFICHVRLKRSGAWWYELNSNQMLALRCAKYNGTFEQVFKRHQQRSRGA